MKHRIPAGGPRFGFGYECPVVLRDRIRGRSAQFSPAASPLASGSPSIEISSAAPLWERIEAYGHEVVHAAIDFERWLRQEVVEPMKQEVEETRRHLREDHE